MGRKGLTRRPSFDSVGVLEELAPLSLQEAEKIMPFWTRQLLRFGGGPSGDEPVLVKCAELVCVLSHTLSMGVGMWLVGLPLFEIAVLTVLITTVITGFYASRWRLLRSGILWSLARSIDPDGRILRPYGSRSFMLLVFQPVESLVPNLVFALAGLVADLGGRSARLSPLGRKCCWATLALNVPLYTFVHYTVKGLPLLFNIVCEFLVEDIRQFQARVDAIFEGSTFCEEALQSFHQWECGLRARQTAVNKVMGPAITATTGAFLCIITVSVFLLLRAQSFDDPVRQWVSSFFLFVIAVTFLQLVLILRGAARVGDTWNQLLDDLNSPMLLFNSKDVLGITLPEHLQLLKAVGVEVFGSCVTSQTVLSVSVSVGSGLFMTLVGTMLATS